MPTYDRAPTEWTGRVARVMREHHSELADAGVTVDLLLAYAAVGKSGARKGPAVKLHGRSCYAKIRITALDERVAGRADCEIVLDGDRCGEWPTRMADAVIDHELTHVWWDMAKGEDDAGRPRLKVRLHDHDFGWFNDCVRRFGGEAVEVKQFADFRDGPYTQLWLPGIDEAALKPKRKRGKEAAVKD
jgi:hypothetical protein